MKRKLFLIALFSSLTTVYAQNVVIPDPNFKAYLVGNPEINTNADSEIQVSEASAFAGQIFAGNLNISDLTGISAFTNITQLQCHNNQLTSLDLNANQALIGLNADGNQMTSITFGQNPSINYISCNENQLTSIDVSGCSALEYLYASGNNLTSVNLGNNNLLHTVWFNNNQLASLDVSQIPALANFQIASNQLTSLNLSNNPALVNFGAHGNMLSTLNLVSNVNLVHFTCSSCGLTSLNIKNGNNTALVTFNVYDNQNLNCVEVDNPAYSSANWTWFNSPLVFLDDCNTMGLDYVESSSNALFPNPVQNVLNVSTDFEGIARILTVDGRTIETFYSSGPITKQLENYSSGVYFLHLGDTKRLRFVKE